VNFLHLSVLSALITDIILGAMVLATNWERTVNKRYFLLSVAIGLWLSSVLMILLSSTAADASFWIRLASIFSAMIPVVFNLLRLSIKKPSLRLWQTVRQTWWMLVFNGIFAILCQTAWFLSTVAMPSGESLFEVPEPVYGPGLFVFNAYYLMILGYLISAFIKDIKASSGLMKLELQFVALGCSIGIFTGATLAIILPTLIGSSKTAPLAPLGVILLNIIISYGIATKRIMDVSRILQKMVAYVFLSFYLGIVYFALWLVFKALLVDWFSLPPLAAHLTTTVVTLFFAQPAQARVNCLVNRFFDVKGTLDPSKVVREITRNLQSVVTTDLLEKEFPEMIKEAFDVPLPSLYLQNETRSEKRVLLKVNFSEAFPDSLASENPLVEYFSRHHAEVLVADLMQRSRLTPERSMIFTAMREIKAGVTVGFSSRGHLLGLLLLQSRRTGKVFSFEEQDALQLLCNQFAVALENARLYTEVQNSKIYNDILLENLVTGVIAADENRKIHVFNREAQHITGLPAEGLTGRPIARLPYCFSTAMLAAYERGEGVRDLDLTLVADGREIPVRVGTAAFRRENGSVLGVLLVFNDLTAIRKLESQVRRTDRLASVGTLAAGMAHEIKNPLVTIKTFSQLLPERYEDEEFREIFSRLIGQEAGRIDTIVNQLLRFAKPVKPELAPLRLHNSLDHTLNLVQEQLKQKNIVLHRDFAVENDLIYGDANLLIQLFVNIYLNAVDAMREGDVFTVSTRLTPPPPGAGRGAVNGDAAAWIQVEVRDTGKGIPPDQLSQIFDPFFTSKSEGTGLGLSVSYGIVREHGGLIDVQSTVGQGASFYISFPLINEEPGE